MIKLLYGTGNPAKIAAMQRRVSKIDIEIIGLSDLKQEIPYVFESGSTPLENARLKAISYYRSFHIPVFSCDSGLYFEGVPEEIQPGVHVRTVNGVALTDEEMITHYSNLAKKYGDITARYRHAICLVYDENHIYDAMDESMASAPFRLTSKPHAIIRKGFPLDSLSLDIESGQYYYDKAEEELDQVAVEDGFLAFFKQQLEKFNKL